MVERIHRVIAVVFFARRGLGDLVAFLKGGASHVIIGTWAAARAVADKKHSPPLFPSGDGKLLKLGRPPSIHAAG